MSKCAACGKFLSQAGAAICTTCPGMFHKGCVAMPESVVIRKDWSCPDCKKRKSRKGDNTCTPVKGLHDDLTPAFVPEALDIISTQRDAAPSTGDSDIRAMRRELAVYIAESREFRNEFRATISSIGERMDRLETRLDILENREVPTEPLSSELGILQETVVKLKSELNERDQDSLLADLDIGSLPEEKGENVVHTVTVLAAKLGVSLDDRDIVFAERVGAVESGGRARRVVVRLARRHVRDDLLRAARVRRNLTSADIGLPGAAHRVYINERLTRTHRQLFYRAREECRRREWRYSWTKRGRVYVRQSDGKPAYPIRVETDFARVFGTEGV